MTWKRTLALVGGAVAASAGVLVLYLRSFGGDAHEPSRGVVKRGIMLAGMAGLAVAIALVRLLLPKDE